MQVIKNYDVHLDSKKRITLKDAMFLYYNVKEYDNGCILLEPGVLKDSDSISANTLKEMDKAVNNFKLEKVSAPVDLSDFS